MAGTTYMDYGKMENIRQGFNDAAQTLNAVAKVLEALMMALKMTAFMGLVGGLAVERYLSVIQPQVEQLSKQFDSISDRLAQAIKTTQAGEQAGNSL